MTIICLCYQILKCIIYVLAFIIFSEATQTSEKGIAIENKQNETKDLKSNPCKVFFLLLF